MSWRDIGCQSSHNVICRRDIQIHKYITPHNVPLSLRKITSYCRKANCLVLPNAWFSLHDWGCLSVCLFVSLFVFLFVLKNEIVIGKDFQIVTLVIWESISATHTRDTLPLPIVIFWDRVFLRIRRIKNDFPLYWYGWGAGFLWINSILIYVIPFVRSSILKILYL